jgi:hypothetical protein
MMQFLGKPLAAGGHVEELIAGLCLSAILVACTFALRYLVKQLHALLL